MRKGVSRRSKLQSLMHELGLLNSALYILNLALNKLPGELGLYKYYFVSQRVANTPLAPKGRGKNISVVEITESVIPNPCPRPKEVIASRFNQGAKCYAAYRDDVFLGCLWYVPKQYIEDEVRCVFELETTNSVWDFDVYVVPKYRFSPVFIKLWDHAYEQLTLGNYNYTVSRISAFNSISLSSHKRMGARVIGSAVFLYFGQFELVFSKKLPLFMNVSWSEKRMPTIRLKAY